MEVRTITTTGGRLMSDIPLLFLPDLTYENVEIVRCTQVGVCNRGLGNHEEDCPLFEDSSHARDRDGRTYL
jgi:hypothetical protein